MALATIEQCKKWNETREQRNQFAAAQFASVTITGSAPRRVLNLDPTKIAEAQASNEWHREQMSKSREIGAASWKINRRNKAR